MDKEAFILDFNLLSELGLSIDEFIALISLVKPVAVTIGFESLQEKQYVKILENNEIILREKGNLFIELMTVNKKKSINNVVVEKASETTSKFVREFRELWRGQKVGSMGSLANCKLKMKRWRSENPEYSEDQILKAAKIYLNSVDNIKYLQAADNFIFKKEGKEESSRLSAFIEEIDDKPITDWTTSLI